jgi:dTMP kinase
LKPLGVFITLEGIDGTGKSTHHRLLVNHLRRTGLRVCSTREPGGTSMGERVRRILMDSRTRRLAPLAELALFYAARAQHVEDVVRPALERGEIVVSDRFNDASLAYQGYGRQLGDATVRALDRVICGPTQPDLTLVLDLPVRAALTRAREREKRRKSPRGRFETQGLRFHERVRAGYLAIARKDRQRVKVIRADRPIEKVQTEIQKLVHEFLKNASGTKGRTR